jgi:hypothetical protein
MPRADRTVQIPGETPSSVADGDLNGGPSDGDEADRPVDQMALLMSQMRAMAAEIAQLKVANAALPPAMTNIYEPETEHGKQAKAASKHLHLTAAQLTNMVAAGEVADPPAAVLCSDGWYSPGKR